MKGYSRLALVFFVVGALSLMMVGAVAASAPVDPGPRLDIVALSARGVPALSASSYQTTTVPADLVTLPTYDVSNIFSVGNAWVLWAIPMMFAVYALRFAPRVMGFVNRGLSGLFGS